MPISKKIVLTTFGSLGDLHPYLALALELKSRGHNAVIATSECYRDKVEGEGLTFCPVRPDMPEQAVTEETMRRIMHMSGGPEYLFRQVLLPVIRETYADLLAACDGADAIVGHPLTFTVPIVAKKLGIPWAYVALSPIVFASAYDPPTFSPSLIKLRSLHPLLYNLLFKAVRTRMDSWFGDLRNLSREVGTYPVQRQPVGRDQYSETLNLALFPSILGAPQRDWPTNTVPAGFAHYEPCAKPSTLPADLDQFLRAGDPPVVFTLGSAAVNIAGSFYSESLKAAKMLDIRAVMLVGRQPSNVLSEQVPKSIFVADYAPYAQLFPRAAAVVHQGGIGTTSQCLTAGKPMLVMPFAFDQPDNAARVTRLGVGRTVARWNYSANIVVRELQLLMSDHYRLLAANVGRIVRMENGSVAACDAIESKLI